MRRANRSARFGMVSASASTASAAADRRMIVRPKRLVGTWGTARGAGAGAAMGMGRAEAKRGEVRSMRMKLRMVVKRKEDLASMLVCLVWYK